MKDDDTTMIKAEEQPDEAEEEMPDQNNDDNDNDDVEFGNAKNDASSSPEKVVAVNKTTKEPKWSLPISSSPGEQTRTSNTTQEEEEEEEKEEEDEGGHAHSHAHINNNNNNNNSGHHHHLLPMLTTEEVMELRNNRKHQKKRCACIMVQLGLIGVIIAIVLSVQSTSSSSARRGGSSNDQQHQPIMTPSLLREMLPQVTLDAMLDPDSAQSRAFEWLLEDVASSTTTTSATSSSSFDNNGRINQYTKWRTRQRFALATLYFSTIWGGDTHQWNSINQEKGTSFMLDHNTNECQWMLPDNDKAALLQCNEQGAMIRIDLSHRALTGRLPLEFFWLLPHLEYIDLSHNDLSGSLPNQILTLKKLQEVYLYHNPQLKGHMSPYGLQWTRLSQLRILQIHGTSMSGRFSNETCSQLTHHLRFTCQPSVLCGCGCVCQDQEFDEQQHAPQGREDIVAVLPEYSQVALLDGTSPQSHALTWLIQDSKNLTLYSEEQRLQRFALATLYYATQNDVDASSSNGNKETNWLSYNHHECDFAGIVQCDNSTNSERYITQINLYENGLQGSIPAEVALLTSLTSLDLSNNALSGPLPTELGLLTNMVHFDVSDNTLTGSFPSEIGLLTNLVMLDLSWNHLTRALPATAIGQLTQLQILSLNDNNFKSVIPSPEMGNLKQLRALYLHDNDMISGLLPNADLMDLPFLERLTVNATFVSGRINRALCELEQLEYTCSDFLCGCGDCACPD